ncbi:Hypothetical protein NTJ_05880 [Nesidiocoris tenuis]|uniref:Uncharacterized protein n=1 Tax=Nesidiocoris tenuis TaxID=355587 RepID=A0ABN7ALF4_9HEMI|nr:Hypothetical protein NTJ_05880 [Nesidiocoris tenuis]
MAVSPSTESGVVCFVYATVPSLTAGHTTSSVLHFPLEHDGVTMHDNMELPRLSFDDAKGCGPIDRPSRFAQMPLQNLISRVHCSSCNQD